MKSAQEHDGAIFSACKKEKWIFTGGWDKTIKVKVCAQHMKIAVFVLFMYHPNALRLELVDDLI